MVNPSVDEAQSQLPKLIELAQQGEEVVIERAGTPVARLVPYKREAVPRRGGQWRGRVHIASDFDELPPDIGQAFGVQE